jgi:hypothetical protein
LCGLLCWWFFWREVSHCPVNRGTAKGIRGGATLNRDIHDCQEMNNRYIETYPPDPLPLGIYEGKGEQVREAVK